MVVYRVLGKCNAGPLPDEEAQVARFADTYRNEAVRFIAEGDFVVVECRGNVMTRTGKPYQNTYCYVCEFRNGQLHELTEYMDTEHATEALGAP